MAMMATAECSIWSYWKPGKCLARPVARENVTRRPSGVNETLAASSQPRGTRSGAGLRWQRGVTRRSPLPSLLTTSIQAGPLSGKRVNASRVPPGDQSAWSSCVLRGACVTRWMFVPSLFMVKMALFVCASLK